MRKGEEYEQTRHRQFRWNKNKFRQHSKRKSSRRLKRGKDGGEGRGREASGELEETDSCHSKQAGACHAALESWH